MFTMLLTKLRILSYASTFDQIVCSSNIALDISVKLISDPRSLIILLRLPEVNQRRPVDHSDGHEHDSLLIVFSKMRARE